MGVLIDASILIHVERRAVDLRAEIETRRDEPFFLSVITASELLHGVHRAANQEQHMRRSAYVEALLRSLPILPIGLNTARQHAQLWAGLAARGQMIGPHDLWLAASCIAHGLSIATLNVREFDRVPGLAVERWFAE